MVLKPEEGVAREPPHYAAEKFPAEEAELLRLSDGGLREPDLGLTAPGRVRLPPLGPAVIEVAFEIILE